MLEVSCLACNPSAGGDKLIRQPQLAEGKGDTKSRAGLGRVLLTHLESSCGQADGPEEPDPRGLWQGSDDSTDICGAGEGEQGTSHHGHLLVGILESPQVPSY